MKNNLNQNPEIFSTKKIDWNNIQLNTPVAISVDEYIWIGYHIEYTSTEAGYPPGTDNGPTVSPGYSDLLLHQGVLYSIHDTFDCDFNWMIHGLFTASTGDITNNPSDDINIGFNYNTESPLPKSASNNIVVHEDYSDMPNNYPTEESQKLLYHYFLT